MPGMRRGKKRQQPQEPSWWNAAPNPAHFGLGPEWSVVPARPGEPEPAYHRPPFGLPVTPKEREAHRQKDASWYLNEQGDVRNHVCTRCGNVKTGPHTDKKTPTFQRGSEEARDEEYYTPLRVVTPEGFLYKTTEEYAEADRLGYDHNYSGGICAHCADDMVASFRARKAREQGKEQAE